MSMEEAFIRGCYYYYTDNSVWYIYRAKMANYAAGLELRAAIRMDSLANAAAAA